MSEPDPALTAALAYGLDAAGDWLAGNVLRGGVCDFCTKPFTGREVLWRTNGNVIVGFTAIGEDGGQSETSTRNYGDAWAACTECDEILMLHDPDALLAHVFPILKTGDDDDKHYAALHTLYHDLLKVHGLHRAESIAAASKSRPNSRAEADDRLRLLLEEARALNEARVIRRDSLTAQQSHGVARHSIALFIEAERLDSEWKLGVFDASDHETLRLLKLAVAAATEFLTELARAERIEARRAGRNEPAVMEGRKCSACGTRDARVDDLCKRCAHAAGTLPKGKIT